MQGNRNKKVMWSVSATVLLVAVGLMLWPLLSPTSAQSAFDQAKDEAYERRVSRDNQSLAKTLSSMPQQGQADLELYLAESLREAAGASPDQQQAAAIQCFEDMWHPGIAAMSNMSYPDGYVWGGVSIAACARLPQLIEPYYHTARVGAPTDPNQPTDIFRVGEWGEASALEIEAAQDGSQGVAVPSAYDGSDFIGDPRPRFYKAWLYRDRGGDSKPIFGLWAIDDGGSWWLASVTLP